MTPLSAHAVPRQAEIPHRYSMREKDGVRFLECDEAPRLRVFIEPGMSISRSDAAALGERVILLDGAGQFGPLIDNDKKLYNLDHHAGCERLFTLATCEQAMLLVHSGLELSDGDWRIYANDPDLDTVLAIWCLLNHRRLRELGQDARDVLLPLLRLEGAIDANGPDLAQLCGLPSDVLVETERTLAELVARERGLKQAGSWSTKNVHGYTLEMLGAVDSLIYRGEDFGDYTRIEEVYGHVELAPRRVAVACRDSSGIYAVEQRLKTKWGDQLAMVVLENEPGHYTLRRTSSLSGPALQPVYDLLNRVDPAVDGRPTGKRWGGSQDIGGSPRPEGTLLTPDEVLALVARAQRPPTRFMRTRRTATALATGLALLLLWPIAALLPSPAPPLALPPPLGTAYEIALAALLALGVGLLALRTASQRRPWVFGWRPPANGGGLWLLAPGALGALPFAAWLLVSASHGALATLGVAAASALALAAVEAWFRGLVHGLLVLHGPVQRPRGPWLLSRAALASAAAYAGVATALATIGPGASWLAPMWPTPWLRLELIVGVAALAFGTGLALAIVRERSLSLAPGLAVQVAALVIATGVALGIG